MKNTNILINKIKYLINILIVNNIKVVKIPLDFTILTYKELKNLEKQLLIITIHSKILKVDNKYIYSSNIVNKNVENNYIINISEYFNNIKNINNLNED
jgi:hypothetical protein